MKSSIRLFSRFTKRRAHEIPIYGGWMDIVLCDDLSSERKQYDSVFGVTDPISPLVAGNFSGALNIYAIFLQSGVVSHGVIGHEIFHAVLRILEDHGESIEIDHDEPAAYLCDWLTEVVYSDLSKWKTRITRSKR